MIIKSKYRFFLLFSLLLTSQFFSANAADKLQQQGKLVWSDLYSGDVEASIEFYNKAFGWSVKKFGNNESPYHIFYDGVEPIAGVLSRETKRNQTEKALWIGSFTANNVQAMVKKSAEQKATIILEPHTFDFYGKRAVIADPQGGIVALLELDPSNNQHKKLSKKWLWAQLFSVNTDNAAAFYQHSFDLDAERLESNENAYYLSQQGEVSASIVSLPQSFEQRDRWINFLEVNNLTTLLKRVQENGGKVVYHSTANENLAIISDPNGALLGLTEQEAE
ncbi:MAG: VOC family protein [Colwellia sp.]|nr:VOC family protein [Colwellia sp.]MCW8865148.1 VOC family protein [Colwellia sp.]MCW9082497.1 VOC family protein [Colwellia sp.]